MLSRGGIDSGDPEGAEVSLSLLPVPVSVDPRLLDRFLGRPVKLGPASKVTLRLLEHALAPTVRGHPPLYSGHLGSSRNGL